MRSWLLVALAFVASAGGMAFAFREAFAGTPTFVLLAIAPSALMAAAFVVRELHNGELAEAIKPRWGDFSGGALGAAALFAVAYGLARVLAPPGSEKQLWLFRLYHQLGSTDVLREKAVLSAVAIGLFAIADGLAWRGLVPSLLAERVGSRRAWAVAAVLYGVSYAPAAWVLRDPVAGPNTLFLATAMGTGLVLGALARTFRRLVPSLIAHALFAWFSLMTYRLLTPSV